jgi:hypothetical protein
LHYTRYSPVGFADEQNSLWGMSVAATDLPGEQRVPNTRVATATHRVVEETKLVFIESTTGAKGGLVHRWLSNFEIENAAYPGCHCPSVQALPASR